MEKRDPKPQFVDVACPNKACELYSLTDHENVVGTHYEFSIFISYDTANAKLDISINQFIH